MDLEVGWGLMARRHRRHSYIAGGENASELADVPPSVLASSRLAAEPLMDKYLAKKWCLLRFPTPSGAQAAGMSTEAFEDFCLDVSTLDYARMDKAMDPLVELMSRTDRVRIVSPETDLSFSIKGIPVLKAAGKNNIPDGEVFTAPVRDSANGTILCNTPSLEDGTTYERVRFTFKDGKIVDSDANEPEKLLKMLDTDEGSRYLGEFALGMNPRIERPMKDTLYDEKIGGSLHLPGRASDEADNGNRRAHGTGPHPDAALGRRGAVFRRGAARTGAVLPELEANPRTWAETAGLPSPPPGGAESVRRESLCCELSDASWSVEWGMRQMMPPIVMTALDAARAHPILTCLITAPMSEERVEREHGRPLGRGMFSLM
jgi:hypothetical protein